MTELNLCPICAGHFKAGDMCATDIELGMCHAGCLEGAPTVDLDTGEPVEGPIPTYRYDEDTALSQPQAAGEPVAFLVERLAGPGYGKPRTVIDAAKYDPRRDDFWCGDAKTRHLVTPLYASPPHSGEVEALPGTCVIDQRLEQMIGSSDPTSREAHDMAVELIIRRRSALSVAPATADGWRTMDSAPKDGTKFIAIGKWGHPRCFEWSEPENYWRSSDGQEAIRREYQDDYLWTTLPDRLPAAPTATGGR